MFTWVGTSWESEINFGHCEALHIVPLVEISGVWRVVGPWHKGSLLLTEVFPVNLQFNSIFNQKIKQLPRQHAMTITYLVGQLHGLNLDSICPSCRICAEESQDGLHGGLGQGLLLLWPLDVVVQDVFEHLVWEKERLWPKSLGEFQGNLFRWTSTEWWTADEELV